jgi:phage host-nuclease inhibitor protein Gam
MATEKTVETEDPKLTKLVRVYLKMKEKKDEIDNTYKEQTKDLADQMALVKSALLDYCK